MKVNYRRVILYTCVLSFVLSYGLLWLRMITSHAERTGTDFVGFYTAARITQAKGADSIYIPEFQQEIEQQLVGFKLVPGQVLLFNHIPYFVPLLCLITDADYVASFIRWTLILLMVIAIDSAILLSTLRDLQIDRRLQWTVILGTALFFPMFTSVMNGQDTVFLLLGVAIWFWGLLSGKDRIAGLGLSLATIRPQVAMILALPFLFHRRTVWWWFMLGSAILGGFVVFYLGPEGTSNFLNILLVSSRGEWYGLHPEEMPTLTGFLHRVLPGLGKDVIQFIGLGGFALAIGGLCLLWAKTKKLGEREIGLAVLAAIFFIPYMHYHDLTLLLIPLFCLIRLVYPERKEDLALLPLIISFVLLLGFFWAPIRYWTVGLVMAAMVFALLRYRPGISPKGELNGTG